MPPWLLSGLLHLVPMNPDSHTSVCVCALHTTVLYCSNNTISNYSCELLRERGHRQSVAVSSGRAHAPHPSGPSSDNSTVSDSVAVRIAFWYNNQ